MNAPAASDVVPFWETAGRRVGASLGDVTAIAVIGDDAHATATVALGLALEQGLRRRVALADLLDDPRPYQSFGSENAPGISDSILHGVSIERIAHAMPQSANLRFLPGGLDTPLTADVLESRQWRALIDRVQRADALLVLAMSAGVASADALVGRLDGVVLVGSATRPPSATHVLGEVRNPARSGGRRAARLREVEVRPSRARRWMTAGALAAGIALAAVGVRVAQQRSESSARVNSVSAGTAAVVEPTPPAIVPDDASWGVEIASLNTERGAADRVRGAGELLPAATFSPTQLGDSGTRWFTVVTGAYDRRERADSLLQALTARGAVTEGAVVRLPWALAIDTLISADSARARVETFRIRGVPAYGLLQADGRVRLYAGAFASPENSALLRDALDYVNINSTLVARVGRIY